MKTRVIKDTFSHASCKVAMALAAKAIAEKLQSTPDLETNPNALTEEELDLLNRVQRTFGQGEDTQQEYTND